MISGRLHSEIIASRCSHGPCPIEDCVNFFVTVQRIQSSLFSDLGDSVNHLLSPGRTVLYFPANNATYSIPSPCRAIVLSEPSTTTESVVSMGAKTVATPDARYLWLLVLLPDGVEAPSPNAKIYSNPATAAPSVSPKTIDSGIPGMTVLRRKDDDMMLKPIGKAAASAPPPPQWQEASSSCKFNGKQRNYMITKVTVADIALVSGLKLKPPNASTIATGLGPVLTDLDKAPLEMEIADLLRESKAKHLSFEAASKQSGLAAFAQAYALCK